jgi:hypothetical protein
MPAEVKDRVHALARRANASRGLAFTNSDGVNLDILYPAADDDDSDYDPDDSASASSASSASKESSDDGSCSDPASDSDGTDDDPNFNPKSPPSKASRDRRSGWRY